MYLWWACIVAAASVEPRAKPSVFIYDARTLFSLGRSGALQERTRHDLVHADAPPDAIDYLLRSTFDALPIDVASPKSLRRPPQHRCN